MSLFFIVFLPSSVIFCVSWVPGKTQDVRHLFACKEEVVGVEQYRNLCKKKGFSRCNCQAPCPNKNMLCKQLFCDAGSEWCACTSESHIIQQQEDKTCSFTQPGVAPSHKSSMKSSGPRVSRKHRPRKPRPQTPDPRPHTPDPRPRKHRPRKPRPRKRRPRKCRPRNQKPLTCQKYCKQCL